MAHRMNYFPDAEGFTTILQMDIDPMPKPRMTRRDRWAKRPIVKRWNGYKDEVRLRAPRFVMPESDYWIIFTIGMPEGWSIEKQDYMLCQAHQQRPDKDNLEKGILDIFLPDDDSRVFDGRVSKFWGKFGIIEIWHKENVVSG